MGKLLSNRPFGAGLGVCVERYLELTGFHLAEPARCKWELRGAGQGVSQARSQGWGEQWPYCISSSLS